MQFGLVGSAKVHELVLSSKIHIILQLPVTSISTKRAKLLAKIELSRLQHAKRHLTVRTAKWDTTVKLDLSPEKPLYPIPTELLIE